MISVPLSDSRLANTHRRVMNFCLETFLQQQNSKGQFKCSLKDLTLKVNPQFEKKISNITKGPRFKDFQFILVSKCYTKKFIFFLIQNVEQNTNLQKPTFCELFTSLWNEIYVIIFTILNQQT